MVGDQTDRVFLQDFAILSHVIYLYSQGFPLPSSISDELRNCSVFRYVSDNLSDPSFNKPPYISIYLNRADPHFADFSRQPNQIPFDHCYEIKSNDAIIANNDQLSLLRSSHSVVLQGRDLNNLPSFECANYGLLRTLVIAHSVGMSCAVFKVVNMPALEEIIVGEDAFTICHRNDVNNAFANFDRISKKKKLFSVMDCPALHTIKIGNNSFSDFSSFTVSNLPSLQTLEIGESIGIDSYDNRSYSFFRCKEIQLMSKMDCLALNDRFTYVVFNSIWSLLLLLV